MFVSAVGTTIKALEHFVMYMLAPVLAQFAGIDKLFITVLTSMEFGLVAVVMKSQQAWCGQTFAALWTSDDYCTVKYSVVSVQFTHTIESNIGHITSLYMAFEIDTSLSLLQNVMAHLERVLLWDI